MNLTDYDECTIRDEFAPFVAVGVNKEKKTSKVSRLAYRDVHSFNEKFEYTLNFQEGVIEFTLYNDSGQENNISNWIGRGEVAIDELHENQLVKSHFNLTNKSDQKMRSNNFL